MAQVLLEARGIVKRFPGTVALNGVDFNIYPGEIHALVGENGAGKSTLMKILAGVYQPDEGALLLDGVETAMNDPLIAQRAGIGIVHQELSIFPTLSIAENIFSNRQPVKSGLIDFPAMYADAEELMGEFGLNVSSATRAGELSVSEQQIVEIIKAVSLQPKVLILDEPTSALSEAEINRLIDILNKLKNKNMGIVYISHKLQEILTLSDRITVLRDGQLVGEIPAADASEQKLIQMMVGREANTVFPAKNTTQGKRVVMEASHIMVPGKVVDFGFKVAAGEILGVFGLMGAGRTEMARRVFGLGPGSADIVMDGRPIIIKSPYDAMKNGIAYLTEDRKGDGVFLDMTVASNVASANLDQVSRSGLVDERSSETVTEDLVKKLRIKVSSVAQLTGNLSGGNQQKVLLAKYIQAAPKVLIVDEPTRGIDVAAKAEIHGLLRELANEGMAIIVISSELPEVMGMSDRIIVMCNGRLTGEVEGSETNENTIMALATKFSSETGGK